MELLGGEQVSQIRLELEDPKDARSLAAAVEETAGASPHQGEFVVQVDDSAYLQVAGPLERMVSLMTLMAAAAVLLGAAILFLLSLLGAMDRIIHNAYEVLVDGRVSMRERKGLKAAREGGGQDV